MKKYLVLFLLISTFATLALPSRFLLHTDTYKVDLNASTVEWFAEKFTGKHNGTIKLSSGEISNNHGRLSGKFTIDMKTIVDSDLPAGKKEKLENHLKSEDFFAVEKFPTSTFEITTVAPRTGATTGAPNFDVTGKLTIKGITNDITFPANITFEGNQISAKADVKVDRSKFDVRYGSKSFFEDIGDRVIYDEFILKLNIVAVQ